MPRPMEEMATQATMCPLLVSALTVVSNARPMTATIHASHICGRKAPERLTMMPAITPEGAATHARESLA
jgi:hypothetical protein